MRRPVPILTILRNPVIPPSRSHAPASLMFKRGIPQGQGLPAVAAAPFLTLPHQLYAAFVFEPAGFRIDAHFPAIRVDSEGSRVRETVAKRELRVGAGFRDGAAAEQGYSSLALLITASAILQILHGQSVSPAISSIIL